MSAVQRPKRSRLPLAAAAFVALVCTIILTIAAVWEWTSRKDHLAAAKVSMANLAHSLTQHVEDSFDLLDTGILGVVSRLETDGPTPDTLSKLQKILIARKAGSNRIHMLGITDDNGNWLVSSGAEGENLLESDYLGHHRQSSSREAFVGSAARSLSDGEWVTTVSRRYNHPDGSFAGVVVATVSASYFSDYYDQFDIGKTGTVSLVGNNGVVEARRPNDHTVGRDLSNTRVFRDLISRGPSGAYDFRSAADGMRRVGFFQHSTRFPFIILVTKAQDEILASWRRAAIVRATVILSLVGLLALIGAHLVRQLAKGQRMTAVLATKEADFRLLAEGSSDMVMRIGVDDRIRYASPSAIRVLGLSPDQLVGNSALAGIHPDDLPQVKETVERLKRGEIEEARTTHRLHHAEKGEIWIESTLRVTRNSRGEIDGAIAISRDVTEQKGLEVKLETLATEDGLTELANRRSFDERLAQEWGRAYRERTPLGLLMIDLDRFKSYNDTYGHLAGDDCLRTVAAILKTEVHRNADLAARYGGEEFAVLLPNTDAAGCARLGERIRRALREQGLLHAGNLPSGLVTASVGGAVCWPWLERGPGPDSLVEAADRALYEAKDGGRDRLVMSSPVASPLPAAFSA